MDNSNDAERDRPLLIEGPKKDDAAAPIIDLKASDTKAHSHDEDDDDAGPDPATFFIPPKVRIDWHWPLAAGVVLAAAVGAMAGAGTTATLLRNGDSSTSIAATTARTLGDSIAQLNGELTTLKATLANGQRNASSQFGKLAERIDRSEKSQQTALADPVGKLAKLQDSIDRLEKRQQQATAASDNDVTGSIGRPKESKEEPKPIIAQGWHLRDYYDGRAVVENRNGTLFRVGAGSNLPGLGKVESVKRDNSRIVVVTAGGIITAAIEPARRMPPQYDRW